MFLKSVGWTMFRLILVVAVTSWHGMGPSVCSGLALGAELKTRPNVVFFLVDDLGWADLGVYGSTFHETPNIDGLAASAMRFTNGYAACPVCSPTRASIMTGRHPVRVDITDWIPGSRTPKDSRFHHINDRDNLALEEVTLAEYLKEQGDYQTFFLGKWHLGERGHWPTDQGFDVNIGGMEKGSPPGGYYSPWKNPNLKSKKDGEYLTTRLTDEAVKLVETANREKPFFMMFSYYNVHTPIQPDKRTIDRYQSVAAERFEGQTPMIAERGAISRARQDNAAYASMVGAVDQSVGRVLTALREQGLEDQTIVVFFSDNGGLCTLPNRRAGSGGPTTNLPLRSGKGWLYEGGVREPMIVRAPGVTQAGAVCDSPVMSTDFFPTIVDLVGLPLSPELHADGISLRRLLVGDTMPKRTLRWHYPHYHGSDWKPGASIRDGDWKLIEFYDEGKTELYDLSADEGETNDLAASRPEVRDRLKAELIRWQTEMGAKMPVPR